MFHRHNIPLAAIVQRAQSSSAQVYAPLKTKTVVQPVTAFHLRARMEHPVNWSISQSIHLLEIANKPLYVSDQSIFKRAAIIMVKKVCQTHLSEFNSTYLYSFVHLASSLGVLDRETSQYIARYVRSKTSDVASWELCAISIWVSYLWAGLPTDEISVFCLPMVDKLTDENAISRLSWCIHKDSLTRSDPALCARVEAATRRVFGHLSLPELVSRVETASSPILKISLYAIIAEHSSESVCDPGIAACMVDACADTLRVPLASVVSLAEGRMNLASLTILNIAPTLVAKMEKDLPSRALAGAVLGLNDLVFVSELISALDIHQIDPNELWKIGAWYCDIVLGGDAVLARAIQNRYPELCTEIASGMWDNAGKFVCKEQRIPPAERAVRSAICKSLTAMGIHNMQNIQIVNTPYVGHVFLPSHKLLIQFAEPLSNGQPTGPTQLMKRIVERRDLKIRILNIDEWEKKFLQQSQEEFYSSLLAVINLE